MSHPSKLELIEEFANSIEATEADLQEFAAVYSSSSSQTENILQPGLYSVFILIDDGTWEQPVFRVIDPIPETEFQIRAEAVKGGFISYGIQLDEECNPENVESIEFDNHNHFGE